MGFLTNLSALSVLLPILIGFIHWRKHNQPVFFGYLVLSAVVDLIMLTLALQGIRNIFVLNAFKVLQLGILAYVLITPLKKSPWLVQNRVILSFILAAICLVFILSMGWNTFSFGTYLYNQITIVALAAIGLIKLVKHSPLSKIFHSFYFWLCLGIASIFSLKTIIYVPLELAMADESKESYYWFYNNLHPLISILGNLVFAYAFWIAKDE